MITLLGFLFLIPNANCVGDKVYLESGQVTDIYYFEASAGEIISWEFRTWTDPFIVYFICLEWSTVISWEETSNYGKILVRESGTFRFTFENFGDTGGMLEFEIKIQVIISGYNLILILVVISVISVISIKTLKKLRVKVSV